MLYIFNLKKRIVSGWREEKNAQNHFRLHLIKQKHEMKKNPALKRPLLVMRNMFLFKAFQLFVNNV